MPYFRIWTAPLYNTFLLCLKNTIFKKTLLNINVFSFPLQRLSDIFRILRRSELYIIKCTYIGVNAKQPVFLCDFDDT